MNAQTPSELDDLDLALVDDPATGLRAEARYVHRTYDKRHDALLHRNDYDSSQYDNWEKGYIKGTVEWDVLQAGYFGEWTPLLGWLYFFGDIGGRFGEVEGICRRGSDANWKDGRIREGYIVDSSLAYGAYASLGIGVQYRGFSADVAYRRSWLYSFDATESGTVVFPDNDDALFIQNDGGFEFRLGYGHTF